MKMGRHIGEVGAVILTALLHPVFVDLLHQRALFIAAALCGWALYLARRVWEDRGVVRDWGFREEGFGPAFVVTSVFAAVALGAMTGIALARHTLVLRWEMLVPLVLYPIWGTFQQLLVQGIFVRTVTASSEGLGPKVVAVVVASILFGAVHLPDLALVGATWVLGLVFTLIYLRWQNLWPLGLYHGWLGVFFYYWVLGRDPWMETFARQQ